MDSGALPIFFGFLVVIACMFVVAAVFASAAALRLTGLKLRLAAPCWRKLVLAGLFCGTVLAAVIIAAREDTLAELDLRWQVTALVALLGAGLLGTYLRNLFSASAYRSMMLVSVGVLAFAVMCTLGVCTIALLLRRM